jgi:hypothetical protein
MAGDFAKKQLQKFGWKEGETHILCTYDCYCCCWAVCHVMSLDQVRVWARTEVA